MATSPGSIAFIGFNADGSDNLAFVALEAIAAGEVIFFTDNEWTGSNFNTGESSFSFTATAAIAAGTVVRIDSINTPAPTSNLGTVVYTDATNTGFSNDGDIVYAYRGTSATNPTGFLGAVASNGFTADFATLNGTGLVAGQTALEFTGGIDIAAFTGARNNQASLAAYAAEINNPGNHVTQNAAGDNSVDGIAPDLPFSTTAFTTGAASQTVRFTTASRSVARAEGNAGATDFTFTVERAGGTTGNVDVRVVFVGASSTTDAADFVAPPGDLTLRIPAGQTSATATFQVRGDTGVEPTEQFRLNLSSPTNDAGVATFLEMDSFIANGVIQNDDSTPDGLVGGIRVFDQAPSLQGSLSVPVATDAVQLIRLGTFTGTGTTAAGRAESVAYDGVSDNAYVTNAAANRIDIARVNADGTFTANGSLDLSGLPSYGGVNSVAVSSGFGSSGQRIVAVAYQNVVDGQPGFVALYDQATGALQRTVQVGVLPDQLVFTPIGDRLLVANEGEAVSASNNAPGTVSIISVTNGAANAVVLNTIRFDSLNGEELILRQRGLATLPGQQAGNDIEPEYITVSPDGTRAYVTLQEVNAVAVIDLVSSLADRPMSIVPLGSIDRSLPGNQFDPSDVNGIAIANFPVRSLPQPDAIASFRIDGLNYFITANEGDARTGGLSDESRFGAAGYVLDPTAFPNAAALKADAQLGRLNVLTNVGDTDGDGDFDQVFSFGGRGLSIFRQNADGTVVKVRETGGEFERIIAQLSPTLFNINQGGTAVDNRSDDKGPEPEGVDVGVVNGRTYAFVALERVNGVMIYDVTDPANASFVGYRPGIAGDFGPETVEFVSAADSPTGDALVLTANEVSGTTTLYRVVSQTAGNDRIAGGPDADVLNGFAGNDLIGGGGGNDTINGGDGDDFVGGEAGDDRIAGSAGNDVLFGDAGNDLVGGGSGADRLFGGEGDDFMGGEADNDFLDGGNGVDVLFGDAGNDAIIGGAGNDRLFGGDGADALDGQDGDDFLDGGADADRLSGGAGADRIDGGTGNDLIGGGADGDTLSGQDGDDTIGGEAGNDTISGGAGADRLFGDAGNDLIGGGAGADGLFGGDGDDFMGGEADDDFLDGGAGVDVLFGDAGNDSFLGGAGDDRLFGGDGNDIFNGQAGDDQIDGGAGTDTAVFFGNRAAYTITSTGGLTTVTGGDGTDRLLGIERLQFGDQVVTLSGSPAEDDELASPLPALVDQSLVQALPDFVL